MESTFILCQFMTVQGYTIHANELSLFEVWAMEMSTHWAATCDTSVKSDRGNRQTGGKWTQRSHFSRYVEQAGKNVAANYSVFVCVCECLCRFVFSSGWQMSDLSAPPPLQDHLLDQGHLEDGLPLWTDTVRLWPSLTNVTWSHDRKYPACQVLILLSFWFGPSIFIVDLSFSLWMFCSVSWQSVF